MYMAGDEDYQTEQHWADDNFGHFSHQEECEEDTAQNEQPYDY